MPTLVEMLPSPNSVLVAEATNELSYKEVIRQLAAQTQLKPYGDIPPLLKKRNNNNDNNSKKRRRQKLNNQRRMSHVEDWIKVDSKESLPDEEDLVQSSPFKNFLSQDLFTQVLPLHMPPPSLSKKDFFSEDDSVVDYGMEDDDEDNDNDDDIDDIEDDDDDDDDDDSFDDSKSEREQRGVGYHHRLRKSFTKSASFISTLATHTVSSSPPQLSNIDHHLWQETIAKLKQTLNSTKQQQEDKEKQEKKQQQEKQQSEKQENLKKRTKKMMLPMPIPPRKPIKKQKRRSEATTQPRFNPDTNTYTRDTRSNSDHLRIISAELNMMRKRKLLSPLKPRGFLPRRKDPFIRGENRKRSQLIQECTL